MTRSTRVLVLCLVCLLSLIAIACGPTAEAPRHTLPPRSINPNPASGAPFGTPTGGGPGGEPASPGGSHTPPPPGIAQPMTSFPQGNAYEIDGVTATPSGFLAVGYQYTTADGKSASQGIVWTSADGMTWQPNSDPAFIDVSPYGVVALGSDVYIYGEFSQCAYITSDEQNCEESPQAGTVIFKSSNGGAWQQLAQTEDIVNASFESMIPWNSTLVAWGYDAANGDTTLWTSTDALTWTPSNNMHDFDSIDAVGAGGPGIVALGEKTIQSIEDIQPVGKTSADGLTFNDATVPQVTGAQLSSVVAGPGGMAAIGSGVSDEQPSVGFALYSADGINWSEANASDNSFDNGVMNDVHANGSGYIAVGSTVGQDDFTLQTGRVWVSGDGHSWRSLGDFGGSFTQYADSALGPTGMVIFTSDDTDLGDNEAVPTSTIYGWFLPASQLVP